MLGKLGIFFKEKFWVWEKFKDLEGTILVLGGKFWFLRENPGFEGKSLIFEGKPVF